ncbi:U3 snoRNP protein [Chytriomyces hyalinus]|nr:U3 snoRNP protein [Chytriomyces hyalinus]
MAEQVRFHLEKMLPELEDLEQKGVFTKLEIRDIVKRRTDHEYAIHRRIGRRADFLKYIEYEINLDRLRKKRKLRLGLDMSQEEQSNPLEGSKLLGYTLSDYSLTRRVNALYQKALKKFAGDVELWVLYFDWAKSMGSSAVLGRSFARAIQLHPTNPSMYILAAQYEFQDNNNMTSARVLMQRGLRFNKEAKSLWHEYLKLELLWTEKIKERRRILFGEGKTNVEDVAAAVITESKKRKLEEDKESSEEDTGVHLDEEVGKDGEALPESTLEIDPAIDVSNDSIAQDPALTMGKELSVIQKAMLELSIPKAIYRNAIKEIPNDLEFRLGFLRLYQTFGSSTLAAQEEVYESLRTDFGSDPLAIGVIAGRHLVGLEVSDAKYPSALKAVVGEYESYLETNPTAAMWTQYTHFLTETLSSVTESNLQRYIFVILSKAYKRAHSLHTCTPAMYIAWSRLHNHDSKAKLDILDQALLVPEHERSGLLWAAKLNEVIQSVPAAASIEDVEALVTRALQLVGKPKSSAGESNTSTAAAASKLFDLKTERFEIWKLYLEWATSENGGGANKNDETRIAALERRFRDCLSVQELGGTSVDTAEFEAYIVGVYLDWSFTVGGIERVRSASDRLLSFKQRSTFFLNLVLEFEERHILQGQGRSEFGGVGALVEAAKRSMKSLVTPTQLTRLRKLHELVCFSDAGRTDSWIAYISFEMYVARDVRRVTEVHWRANKEVSDNEEFALRYDALRTEA